MVGVVVVKVVCSEEIIRLGGVVELAFVVGKIM
jgi:hypothetical protein